jgi:hypothetical protein
VLVSAVVVPVVPDDALLSDELAVPSVVVDAVVVALLVPSVEDAVDVPVVEPSPSVFPPSSASSPHAMAVMSTRNIREHL